MSKPKKATKEGPQHSIMEMASDKAASIKDGIIEGKDKIVAAAAEKFEAVKKAIHDFTASSPKPKAAARKIKKVVRQAARTTIKKVRADKKTAKKAVKKAVKKTVKKVPGK